MRSIQIITLLILCWHSPINVRAQVLDLQTCLDSAESNMPLLQQKQLLTQTLSTKIEIYNKNYLPSLRLNAQISYQSVVPELPFSIPGTSGLGIPQIQYRSYLELYQPIYDAGQTKAMQSVESAQSQVLNQQLDVSKSEFKRQVAQLYFQILLMDKQSAIVQDYIKLLTQKEEIILVAIQNGIAQENDQLKLQSEILNLEQKQDQLESTKKSGIEILSILTGITLNNPTLSLPDYTQSSTANISANPQIKLLKYQQSAVTANRDVLQSHRLPMINAFGQFGIGQPNPFNFFEKDLSPYYIAGIKATWNVWDWNKTSLQKQNIQLQNQLITAAQDQKTQEIQTKIKRLKNEEETILKAIEKGRTIIDLKSQIKTNAETQFKNGTITTTDYLADVIAEQNAKLELSINKIALTQNSVMQQFELGIIR